MTTLTPAQVEEIRKRHETDNACKAWSEYFAGTTVNKDRAALLSHLQSQPPAPVGMTEERG